VVLAAGRAARRGGLLRLAVDAADLRRDGPRQAVLDAVATAVQHGATAVTYRDLVRAAPATRAA
jgi:predicted deacetylase